MNPTSVLSTVKLSELSRDPAAGVLAKDRCLVTFGDGNDIQATRAALEAIVREWIGQL
jgi:hypothetical protein